VNAYFARAASLNRKGDFTQAIEDYKVALDLDQERQLLSQSNSKQQKKLLSKHFQQYQEMK
jgi:hypothetical protein